VACRISLVFHFQEHYTSADIRTAADTPITTAAGISVAENQNSLSAGAHGSFTVTHDISLHTNAKLFSQVGKTAYTFTRVVHTQKRQPQTNLESPTMLFDSWSKAHESLHQVTMLFSDRGAPDGYGHMHGFGSHTFSHTFSLINNAD